MTVESRWERVVKILGKATVEPFVFLVMFGYTVKIISLQSLLHDRACRVSLNYSEDICDKLDHDIYEKYQMVAVKYGNNIYNAIIMISTIPALVMAIFIGPWSDRYSRKFPMLLASAGIFLDSSAQAIITSFPNSSPYWYIISAFISGLSGGVLVVFSSTFSYMSDITDERSRQTRFAALEFFTLMATPIGSFIGGQVFSKAGYLAVMIISPCSSALAMIWMWFFVVETKAKRFDITKKQMLEEIFRLDNLKESYRTCIKPRSGNLRLQIWLLIVVSCSLRFINLGSLAIGFPYTRKTFKWDVERYSYTTTGFSLLNGFATVTIVPILNKRLLVHEAAVGLIGILSLMTKMIIMSVTRYEGLIFYAWFSGCLYACGGIAVRSRISKLVSRNELGKVFSLLATCEAPTPVMGTVIMTQIYNLSLNVYPGLAYAIAAIFLIPAAIIFGWMMQLPSMSFVQYEESEEKKHMKELQDVSANVF